MPEFLARYEFKYLIGHELVGPIRDHVQRFCEPDPYGEHGRYEVNSLYLDTLDWLCARQTLGGIRNRFKARLRTYGWQDTDPVFLEIKGRVGTTILKQRALLDRGSVDPLLLGGPPPDGGYRAAKASHQKDLDVFLNLRDRLDLRPRVWVRYVREAYGSAFGDGSRLTFDTCLESLVPDEERPYVPDHAQWQATPWDTGAPVMVEMKFNGAFPMWMLRIVRSFRLQRISGSKYVVSAVRHGFLPWAGQERGERWTAF